MFWLSLEPGEALNKILAREAVKPKRSSYDNEGLKRVFFEPPIFSLPFFSRSFSPYRAD